MNRNGVITLIATAGLAASLTLTGCGKIVTDEDRKENLTSDLRAMGFKNVHGAKVEKVDFSKKKVIEIQATVAGCNVEFEREQKEDDVATTVTKGGKKIKIEDFVLDEIFYNNDDIAADKGGGNAPTPDKVTKYLRDKHSNLGCLNG